MSASLAATEQEPKETDIGFSGQKEAEEREKLDLELATVISASLDGRDYSLIPRLGCVCVCVCVCMCMCVRACVLATNVQV